MNELMMFSQFVGVGSLLIGVAAIVIWLMPRGSKRTQKITEALHKKGPELVVMASLLSIVGSLAYSLGFALEPCVLCWFQRIIMYPLPLIMGIAMYGKSASIGLMQVRVLGAIGLILSLYHYMTQQFPVLASSAGSPLSCGVSGPSCTEVYIEVFGFLTIPLMAAFFFAFLVSFTHWLLSTSRHQG